MNHHFNSDVAVELGVNAALIVANLAYLQVNREAQGGDKYYMDGRWWVHHTYESLTAIHPYFSVQQIRRIMRKLLEKGAVFHCTPDKYKRDSYWSVAPEFAHVSKSTDRSVGIDSSQVSKSTVVLHNNNIEQKQRKKVCKNFPKEKLMSMGKGISCWEMWVDHRLSLKKPLTEDGWKLQIENLKQFSAAEQGAAIKNSVMNGWVGLFPKKGDKPDGADVPLKMRYL